MLSQAGQQQGISAPHGSTWHKQCSPSPSASQAGRLEGEAARRMSFFSWLAFHGLWRTKPYTQWWPSARPCRHKGLNIKSRYSGMTPASPTPVSHGRVALLLCSLKGVRPLPHSHVTPVKLLVHSFEYKAFPGSAGEALSLGHS